MMIETGYYHYDDLECRGTLLDEIYSIVQWQYTSVY